MSDRYIFRATDVYVTLLTDNLVNKRGFKAEYHLITHDESGESFGRTFQVIHYSHTHIFIIDYTLVWIYPTNIWIYFWLVFYMDFNEAMNLFLTNNNPIPSSTPSCDTLWGSQLPSEICLIFLMGCHDTLSILYHGEAIINMIAARPLEGHLFIA